MKKFLLGTVGLVALGIAAPACAADMAARPYTKAPPMVAAMYDWSGFYIGLNGGGGWARNCADATAPVGGIGVLGCHDASGGTVGGQIGYRWQSGQFVFGLEAQGNWADFAGSNATLLNPLITNRTRVDAFGLFTGQVGYAWNNALLYVKGGAAVTDNDYQAVTTATGAAITNAIHATRWGGVIGGGLEYGFAPNWSIGLEYDHIFAQRKTYDLPSVGTTAFFATVNTRQD